MVIFKWTAEQLHELCKQCSEEVFILFRIFLVNKMKLIKYLFKPFRITKKASVQQLKIDIVESFRNNLYTSKINYTQLKIGSNYEITRMWISMNTLQRVHLKMVEIPHSLSKLVACSFRQ